MKPIYMILLISLILIVSCEQNNKIEKTFDSSTEGNNGSIITEPEINTTVIEPDKNVTVKEDQEPEIIEEKGIVDPDFDITIYNKSKAYIGKTLFSDNHDINNPRIVEINMKGEVIWEYVLPQNMKSYTNPGFDSELLPNNNVLFVLPRKGVFEVDRNKNIVWSYLDSKVSHDADRLDNGNTIVVYGSNDKETDPQVKEVDKNGKIVWQWYARDYFNTEPYKGISEEGWTHTNAVIRKGDKTFVSLRNFDIVTELDKTGKVIRNIGEGIFKKQHDPVFLSNGNILIANHVEPNEVLIIEPDTNKVIWKYIIKEKMSQPVRDVDELPNGNLLITGTNKLTEIDKNNVVVWELRVRNTEFTRANSAQIGFFKTTRYR